MYVYTIHIYNIIVCCHSNTKDLTEFSYSLIGSKLNGHLEWIVTAEGRLPWQPYSAETLIVTQTDATLYVYHPAANEGGLYLVV